jgi:hypothetical protein
MLWSYDNTLYVALEVCKAMLEPIEYLYALFPCPGEPKCLSGFCAAVLILSFIVLMRRVEAIKQETVNACITAGVPPPEPVNLTRLIPTQRRPQ